MLDFSSKTAKEVETELMRQTPDWESHISQDDKAPALTAEAAEQASKEVLHNEVKDRKKVMPLVTALRMLQTAYTKVAGVVAPKDIGANENIVQDVWTTTFATSMQETIGCGESLVAIAGLLDWWGTHKSHPKSTEAQTALDDAASVIKFKGFFVQDALKQLVGLDID